MPEVESHRHPAGSENPAPRIKGSCLCGAVEISVPEPALQGAQVSLCHCINCKKVGGSDYALGMFLPLKDLDVTKNDEVALKAYRDMSVDSGNVMVRWFCATCGSTLYDTTEIKDGSGMQDDAWVRTTLFPPGSVPGQPQDELYCSRREKWQQPVQGAKQHDQMPA